MQGVLYVSHGSRVAEAIEEATSLIERVQAKVNIPLQETCFLELADPDIFEGFRKLVHQGATEISVAPWCTNFLKPSDISGSTSSKKHVSCKGILIFVCTRAINDVASSTASATRLP